MFLYNKVVEFKDWLNGKFVEWRGNTRATLSDFAEYIGVSQQVMNNWINQGALPSSARTLPKLARRYPEVYEVLGLPAPISDYDLSGFPPDVRSRLEKAIKEANKTLVSRNITGDNPEAEKITIRIFEKHGFKYQKTEIDYD